MCSYKTIVMGMGMDMEKSTTKEAQREVERGAEMEERGGHDDVGLPNTQ